MLYDGMMVCVGFGLMKELKFLDEKLQLWIERSMVSSPK